MFYRESLLKDENLMAVMTITCKFNMISLSSPGLFEFARFHAVTCQERAQVQERPVTTDFVTCNFEEMEKYGLIGSYLWDEDKNRALRNMMLRGDRDFTWNLSTVMS